MPESDAQSKLPISLARRFSPAATTLYRVLLLGAVLLVSAVGLLALDYYQSPYWNRIGIAPDQPVLFSHRHHANELRIDCRYCHATVETSAFAGMPSTHTCLTCHSQIFTDTPMLRPVMESATQDRPLVWNRVNSLPDHVYFNHSIHIAKGVGCTTCHGNIGAMALTRKAQPLSMRWCIECHRDPGPKLRPANEIFAPIWAPPPDQAERGRRILATLHLETTHLTNCSTCHH